MLLNKVQFNSLKI